MTGTTQRSQLGPLPVVLAAMEPRADDGDDARPASAHSGDSGPPQWSPVLMTGTTRLAAPQLRGR